MTALSSRTAAWRAPSWRAAAVALSLLVGASLSCRDGGPSGPAKPTTGALSIAISGLPAEVQPIVTVSGPSMEARAVTASETLHDITPGTYTIAAADVSNSESIWAPSVRSQQVVVVASATPKSASVGYGLATGSLTVTIAGLPEGTSADVVVSATNGTFTQHLTGTTTLSRLRAGSYTVTATPVVHGTTTYYVATVPSTQTVVVSAGATADARVDFQAPSGANLVVDGAYIVQSVQRLDRSVPLVQGRAGLLRIFVRASEPGLPAPAVRVRLYNGGQVVLDQKVAPPMLTASTDGAGVSEASLTSSWNLSLPASVIQPGLSFTAQVDPDDVVPEGNETDNFFPLDGQALETGVRTAPPLRLRFVPIYQSANGLTGDVSASNAERFLALTRKLHPVATVEWDVRAPYTSAQSALASEDDDVWESVLHEVDVARDLDSDGGSRQYYGVVRVAYTNGIAGMGYIGYPVAMGWDYLPSGADVMAHELGHTWGRQHAPCGVSGADASYPYAGGQIGAYGYDVTTAALKQPTAPDIMGYCSGKWISDYTYNGVLAYRAAFGVKGSAGGSGSIGSASVSSASAADATAALAPVQRCLLVWGRVSDRGVTLEPAFEVDARPSLPSAGGPLTLSATSAGGSTLWSLSFAGSEIADSPTHTRTFSFAIPVAQARPADIAALRLAAPSGQATSRVTTAPAGAADDEVRVARTARSQWVRVRWNAARHPVVMVRDARTGAVLSFARGGDAEVRTPGSAPSSVDVLLSDRVRSVERRVNVERQ